MDERLNSGQELPHSRIFEAVFPWKFNPDRRLKRMREYFDILFDSHKIIEEPQEIEINGHELAQLRGQVFNHRILQCTIEKMLN